MRIYKRTLKNGMRVLVSPKRSLESVGIVVGIGFGSVDVDARHRELAHCLEHMLFKGTAKRSWADINNITRKYSIYYDAETDYETTLYEAEVQGRYIRNAMELMSDMIKHPSFNSREFRHELGPILHELAIRKEDPDSIVFDNLPCTLFRERSRLLPAKNEKTIEKGVRLQNIVDTYKRYYNPGNAVLAIYGNIDLESGFELARKYFGGFRGRYHKPKRKELTPNHRLKKIAMRKRDIGRGEIAVGFSCSGIRTDNISEYVAMKAVAGLLNNRLYDQIREMRGLSYDPSVVYDAYGTFSYISASAGAPPAKLKEVRSIMLNEFRKLKNGKIWREELEVVKRGLEIRHLTDSDDAMETAIRMADIELMFGDAKMIENEPEMIKRLDVDTIRKLINRYVSLNRYGMITLTRA